MASLRRQLIIPGSLAVIGLALVILVLVNPSILADYTVSNFVIDQPRQLSARTEHTSVSGHLECSGKLSLSEMQIVVYVAGVKPNQEGGWRRSNVPCVAQMGKEWALSPDCTTFSTEYSEFSLIAILVLKDEAAYLPLVLVAVDGHELKSKLCEYAYPCNNATPCNSISPVVQVRRIVESTETPVPPTPTDIPTSTPTNTPEPSLTHTPTVTDTPTATAMPTKRPTMPTPTTPAVSGAPVLLEPESGRCYGDQLTFSWRWYRGLSNEGPYGGEYFALRVWREGAEKRSITWQKGTSHELPLTAPDFVGDPNVRYFWNVAVVRQTGEDRSRNWKCVSPESGVRWFCVHSVVAQPTPTPAPPPPPPTEPPPP
jgi:hypothetical protein